ncbi:hypothetical protein [Phaeodactylibacter sp.]|uniref:hypothetical protein n=1 Tax=Phaeodactylibacter sp. TaxID=1940289 RepID=UPI0025DF61ED|nr:hypothetical protein [Phaeodactylibacter sp.]MCI5093495.1 hypothetical protein [Phaeodactylibacter sp.]
MYQALLALYSREILTISFKYILQQVWADSFVYRILLFVIIKPGRAELVISSWGISFIAHSLNYEIKRIGHLSGAFGWVFTFT